MLWIVVLLSAGCVMLLILLLRALKRIANQMWEIHALREALTVKEKHDGGLPGKS